MPPACCLGPEAFWRGAGNIIGPAVSNHNVVKAALDEISESRPKLTMQEWWQWGYEMQAKAVAGVCVVASVKLQARAPVAGLLFAQ